MKYSIVIPTYNHCDDFLKPCIESIFAHTYMRDVELIISANGSVDNTGHYLNELISKFNEIGFADHIKVVWNDKPLGYSKATNEGIKVSTGEKIILLNNDTILLDQPKNYWIDLLAKPFHDHANCGITGPIKQYSPEANALFIVFFCAMISRTLVNTIGLLSDDYGVGAGEDTEYCIEAERAGFATIECAEKQVLSPTCYTGIYPIYHKGEGTVSDTNLVSNWSSIFYDNGLTLARKYNPAYFIENNILDVGVVKDQPEEVTYSKEQLMNNYERYIARKGELVDGRESARYLWAADNFLGNTVLEIGCSNGYGSQFLNDDIDYLGLDYDKRIIDVAKSEKWGENRKFVHADINTFELGFYDTIIAFEVIEHLTNGLEIVEKLKKHCKRLLISVPYKETPGFWGEHHMLHMLDESHLPGFTYMFIDRDGKLNNAPIDSFINLMLCKYDA